jgi:ribosomal protein S18 acetylase RimI-like enzyme
MNQASIEIRPMQPQEAAEARQLILSVAGRILQPDASEAFVIEHAHELADVDAYQTGYAPPDGLFLVALDGDWLIGTGAIRRLDGETAELRRMWLLEPYQERGIGYRLTRALLAFASQAGYKRIRLTTDVASTRAIRFYHRLGFCPIERYNQSSEAIFLEMILDDQDAH